MRTAVVTGASYGIGESIARTLLNDNWNVYGVSRTEPALAVNDRFVWLECDLSQHQQIAPALQQITQPQLDLLVSNAGVVEVEDASDITADSFDRTFSVNVLAPMLVVNALRNKISGADIISVSSSSDRFPEADLAAYCASKAANTMYFNALARELTNANVYTLLPSYVDTPMLNGIIDRSGHLEHGAAINPADIARFVMGLVDGQYNVESGANIIIVTNKLTEDLEDVEKRYAYNTNTQELGRLQIAQPPTCA